MTYILWRFGWLRLQSLKLCSYMCTYICAFIYVLSYVGNHIWQSIYVHAYLNTHIWTYFKPYMCCHICAYIYVHPYMDTHIWTHLCEKFLCTNSGSRHHTFLAPGCQRTEFKNTVNPCLQTHKSGYITQKELTSRYMDTHIWKPIYERTYMGIHIWIPIYEPKCH